MSDSPIAIIGAGLSGLCLALALHHQQIPCTIYETRPEPLDIGGAIMLSPNALRILDALGVYTRLSPLAFHFDHLYFRTEDDQPLDTFEFGSATKYGYSGMRIYRFELIKVLLERLAEAGITPRYGKKFVRVTAEDRDGVTWAFEDGSMGKARLLVGADGIHSRVRTYIDPDAVPVFTKMVGVTATVPTAQLLPLPSSSSSFSPSSSDGGYPQAITIMNKAHGAFIAAPQRRDGSETLIGKQCHFPEPDPDGDGDSDRTSWAAITADKAWCVDFLRRGCETYPPVVARAVSHIPLDTISLWPFYVIPKLESWVSESGRVIVLGDAAHAIPPTAGQGVNQAFEDVYTFAGVLGRLMRGEHARAKLRENDGEQGGVRVLPVRVVRRWQERRQERIDRVLALNGHINKRRLPVKEGVEGEVFDLGWLYEVDFDGIVEDIVSV